MDPTRRNDSNRARCEVDDVADQLAALRQMTVGQLLARYREVFGEPTRSRNKDHLRKKVGWRIQELAEGGLSDHALARIAALAPGVPVRWRASPGSRTLAVASAPDRDPHVPPPGTILAREHEGALHHVTVLEDGFEYRGERYRSLSRIAQQITGTRWNGFLFFRLKNRARRRSAGASA